MQDSGWCQRQVDASSSARDPGGLNLAVLNQQITAIHEAWQDRRPGQVGRFGGV